MNNKPDEHVEFLTSVVNAAVASKHNYEGKVVRLAFQEGDSDHLPDKKTQAAHFVKLFGERLGRDLELYAFMMKVQGFAAGLIDFFVEVIYPIRQKLPKVYADVVEVLRTGSKPYIPEEHYEFWLSLL